MNSNGGSSFFGSDWLGAFLIIAILFGGGFGFGGNRGAPDVATKEFVQDAVNNQSVQNGIQQLLLATERTNFETVQTINNQTRDLMSQSYTNQINVVQGFNQLSSKLDMLGAQMQACCCDIKTTMLQDKYEALQEKYRDAQNDLSNAQQTQTILNALGRFVTNPPVAVAAANS